MLKSWTSSKCQTTQKSLEKAKTNVQMADAPPTPYIKAIFFSIINWRSFTSDSLKNGKKSCF